jgi:Transglutaminase-like superfamily
MRRLKRFAQLAPSERRLLMRVLFVVGVARTSLWVMPVEAARRAVSKAAAGAAGNSVEQVVWAVRVVSRYLPNATCLTQAIAAQALLTHSGFPSQVEIGVAKERKDDRDNANAEAESRGFHAHAWVVCQGQVVLGGRQVERYNSLMVWDQ